MDKAKKRLILIFLAVAALGVFIVYINLRIEHALSLITKNCAGCAIPCVATLCNAKLNVIQLGKAIEVALLSIYTGSLIGILYHNFK